MSDEATATVVPQGETRYPKSGSIYLLSKNNELTGQIAVLIDELVRRDQQLAELKAQLAAKG